MDITEKAKSYAEGKALDAMTTAIEKAYASGYKDGYDDGYANREKPESEVKYEDLKYVDLGLPSGTRWSDGYLKMTGGEVEVQMHFFAKHFNLPTKEQFQELIENTHQQLKTIDGQCGTLFISKINNLSIFLPSGLVRYGSEQNICKMDNYSFWLKTGFVHGPIIESKDPFAGSIVLVS